MVVRSKIRIPPVRWMPRERLARRLEEVWRHGLTLVVAPAGSGKTTLLADWATATSANGVPVAWYRAESVDGDPATLLGYLEAAISEALGAAPATQSSGSRWGTVEAAAAELERRHADRLMLVIDDLHTLAGTPAETTLERFLEYAGSSLAAVVGTRSLPGFNLSRRRVSGELMEITSDDLRFRSWEVEGLFRDFYGESLQADELARLARRTEGWAAGLQLFHLATRDKTPADRIRLLDGLGHGSRLLREYLARNVLDELPDELRRFLIETCVLRRLSGALCDHLLDRTGSAQMLEELERRQVFTVPLDDAGTYRYHEVLRSHLEGVLVEERGEAAARAWSVRAGMLLEQDGAVAEALAAFCRAEAWDAVDRVLGSGGDRLAARDGNWLDAVPPALLRHDPWLMLATARRLRADGQWNAAVEAFRLAETAFGAADAGVTCRRERLALAAFLEPLPGPAGDWPGVVRAALSRDPAGRRTNPGDRRRPASDGSGARSGPGDGLAEGLTELLGGRVAVARRTLLDVAEDPLADASIAAAARLGAGLAGTLGGDDRGRADLEGGVGAAEAAGQTWLARLGRAMLALADPGPEATRYAEVRALRASAAQARDDWGETLASLIEGWAALAEPEEARPALELAVAGARRLGASTLEAWARALDALGAARAGLPDAREMALQAESLARTVGVPGARLPVHLALALCDPQRTAEHLALAEAASRETGLRSRGAQSAHATDGGDAPPLEIRLLGGFSLAVAGRPIDLGSVKPRPRALLRLLALNAGRPVHREVLAAAFWPEADPETASRNLHVAVSVLRRELGARDGLDGSLLLREGDAYRLVVPAGGRVDMVEVDEAIAAARAARARGARGEAVALYRAGLERVTGELLPEDGPADWVVARRDEVRAVVAEAARSLAELLLPDDPGGAAEACTAGLRVDPCHDPLWRLLIDARERAGDQAAARSARRGYEQMLARLGLEPSDARGGVQATAAGLLASESRIALNGETGIPPR